MAKQKTSSEGWEDPKTNTSSREHEALQNRESSYYWRHEQKTTQKYRNTQVEWREENTGGWDMTRKGAQDPKTWMPSCLTPPSTAERWHLSVLKFRTRVVGFLKDEVQSHVRTGICLERSWRYRYRRHTGYPEGILHVRYKEEAPGWKKKRSIGRAIFWYNELWTVQIIVRVAGTLNNVMTLGLVH